MYFDDLIKKRCSVRAYKDWPVEQEKINAILEAGRLAPTGANRQPQRIIVLNNKENIDKADKATKTFGAPLVFIVCSDSSCVWERPFDGKTLLDIDASIVTTHMMLKATELGLGSVWICWFKPDIIRQEFDLPDNWVPINILAVGYGQDGTQKPLDRYKEDRKPLEELVFYPKS